MNWVKCKNETEKLDAIKNYCNMQITENNNNIVWFEAERNSILDYAEEIKELKLRNAHFKKIIEIIEADEFRSILIP